MNVTEAVVDLLAGDGTSHIFGVPGGGTNLDLIAAARARGIRFVLTRSESAAVFMASAMADLSGSLGVAFATQGPGTASAANGVAQAWLDKSAVVLFTDGWSDRRASFDTHQKFDQAALLRGIVKGHSRLEGERPAEAFRDLASLAKSVPQGPVHIELTGEVAGRAAGPATARVTGAAPAGAPSIEPALALLKAAERPLILAGLEARRPAVAGEVRQLAERLQCPVFSTYKAKGVIPSSHALFAGLFTGGALEAPCVSRADLIILVGFDPVELIGKPWAYRSKVLDIGPLAYEPHYVIPDASLRGETAAMLQALGQVAGPSRWTPAEIAAQRAEMLERLVSPAARQGLSPSETVEIVGDAARPAGARASVDAGAHMFSAMAGWDCDGPNEVLISNGLSTMGFALPAAIAACLQDPERPTVAFTGDGGLLMCAGELATAADLGVQVIVVVFNDGGLSLIELKQRARQLPQGDLRWSGVDFATLAAGAGLRGFRAATRAELEQAVTAAVRHKGPSLIDVVIDPSGYDRQAAALRG